MCIIKLSFFYLNLLSNCNVLVDFTTPERKLLSTFEGCKPGEIIMKWFFSAIYQKKKITDPRIHKNAEIPDQYNELPRNR